MAESIGYVAKFNRTNHAVAYHNSLITDPAGHWATGIKRTGLIVSYLSTRPDTVTEADAFGFALEKVGYYGSPPQGPQATLNGTKAPRSYA